MSQKFTKDVYSRNCPTTLKIFFFDISANYFAVLLKDLCTTSEYLWHDLITATLNAYGSTLHKK